MIAWEESPRQFKMSKQLDEGKFGEDLARKFLNDPIIKVNHGISHYDDVTQDKSYIERTTGGAAVSGWHRPFMAHPGLGIQEWCGPDSLLFQNHAAALHFLPR